MFKHRRVLIIFKASGFICLIGRRSFARVRDKMPFYAVARGRETGVFQKWDECKAQIDGFTGAAYKKFATIEEAEKFVAEGGKHIPKTSRPSPYSKDKPDKKKAESSSSKGADANNNSKERSGDDKKPPADNSKFEYVDVFTDGCCFMNGRNGAVAGIGVHWPGKQADDVSDSLDGRSTNNRAEIKAATKALEQAFDKGITHVRINTDSKFMIQCMTEWIDKWRANQWMTSAKQPVKNKEELEELDSWLGKIASVKWNHVDAHVGIEPNEMADKLAKEGAKKKPKADDE